MKLGMIAVGTMALLALGTGCAATRTEAMPAHASIAAAVVPGDAPAWREVHVPAHAGGHHATPFHHRAHPRPHHPVKRVIVTQAL